MSSTPTIADTLRAEANASYAAKLTALRALPRNPEREAAYGAGIRVPGRFAFDHARPVALYGICVSAQAPIVSLSFEDTDGKRFALRLLASDALWLANCLLDGQFGQRLSQWRSQAERSSGKPSLDVSPQDGVSP